MAATKNEMVSLRDFVVAILQERRLEIDDRLNRLNHNLDESKQAAKDALVTANQQLALALANINNRFDATMEFRRHLEAQHVFFARKSELEIILAENAKAISKSEAAMEKRFEGVNEFRAQLADQQSTFARQGEVNVRIEALEKKLDAAISQQTLTRGKESGVNLVWGALAVISALVISGIGLLTRH